MQITQLDNIFDKNGLIKIMKIYIPFLILITICITQNANASVLDKLISTLIGAGIEAAGSEIEKQRVLGKIGASKDEKLLSQFNCSKFESSFFFSSAGSCYLTDKALYFASGDNIFASNNIKIDKSVSVKFQTYTSLPFCGDDSNGSIVIATSAQSWTIHRIFFKDDATLLGGCSVFKANKVKAVAEAMQRLTE